jgi:type II secretion system protein F
MGKFLYIARDRKGERIEGALEVEDRQAVISRLQAMGYFPVKIEDVTPKSRFTLNLSFLSGGVSQKEMVSFNRQLADLVAAGVPLVKALTIIVNQVHDPKLHEIVADICKAVQGGDTLAKAMQRHPKVFNTLSVAMVRSGETGGMLHEVLTRLADFSENEAELRGKVLASLAYPAVMVLAGIVVILVLLIVVIPKITSVFSSLNQELPGITVFLISITTFLKSYWWVGLSGLAVATLLGRQFLRTKEGRRLFHAILLKIPVMGEVALKRELALFARTLGNLLRNGVPILQALEITEEVITNVVVRRDVEKLGPAISQGTSMTAIMNESPLFPDVMASMIAVGEETAQVDKILIRVSDTYERDIERALKTLTSMLEPLIILALGLVVAFVVIAMLLPIMSLDPTGGE